MRMETNFLQNLSKLKGRWNYGEWAFVIGNGTVLDGFRKTLFDYETDITKVEVALSKFV